MQYRKFGNTDLTASVLGFGMMRLKKKSDGTIDEDWSVKTLRYAIDQGLNYVDTAYTYGDSERVTGLCLQDGYREKVILASKQPVSQTTCPEDFSRFLNIQLERLQTDHIDVYLLHALNRNTWKNNVLKYDLLKEAEKAKAEGKFRYLGFSFHDSLDTFKEILYGYDKWDFCQIQLNYMDTNYQAGLEGLRLAHERGLAVVVMEPLRGGALANLPQDIAETLPGKPVESALKYLWNIGEINVVLSGMSELEQVEQNLQYADEAHVDMLTPSEKKLIESAGDLVRATETIPCTGCNYCDVCPQQIAISEIFKIHNKRQFDGNYLGAKESYRALGKRNAENCIHCGLCAEKCPQQIPVFEKLEKIHKRFI